MNTLFTFLSQSWISTVIGIIGFGLAIYQHFKSTGPMLCFQYIGQRLIDGEKALLPKNVVVQYDGKQVKRLSLSQIIIWNEGKAAIRGQDIVETDPVRFCFGDDTEILSVQIEKTTRRANDCSLHAHQDKLGCLIYKFGFLDHKDGVLIRVLHTGQVTKPTCFGTIIGLPRGIKFLGKVPAQTLTSSYARVDESKYFKMIFSRLLLSILASVRFRVIMLLLTGLMGITLLFLAVFPNLVLVVGGNISDVKRIEAAIFGVLYSLFLIPWWIGRRRFPRSLMPDEIAEDRDSPTIV